MKRTFLAIIMVFISLALMSCGHDHNASPTFVTQILSNPTFDGDIELSSSDVFTVTQGSNTGGSVFAGINPTTFAEFRAFLDFPLTGAGGVPGNAVIVSATLDIVINSILPQPLIGTIPIRIDLVSFQPPTLVETDFNLMIQPALAITTIAPPISQADLGQHVFVDVTSLMVEAQRLGLPDFQIRILEDFGIVSAGLIEINDTTDPATRGLFAPLLQVEYF